jgi:hypothetical protein
MAVALEFIDFIVPRSAIEEKYPGGWEKCLKDHAELIGRRVWHDEHLFRDGAMNPRDIQILVEEWIDLGFEAFVEIDGQKHWKDCCVVEHMFGGPTLPCDWIEINPMGFATLKGCSSGDRADRSAPRGGQSQSYV